MFGEASGWVLDVTLLLIVILLFGIPTLFGIIAAIRYAITGNVNERRSLNED